MDNYSERDALLNPEVNSLGYRLSNRDEDSHSEDDSCQSDEWWSDSSSCSSCDSHVRSVADWQSEVNALGELFHVESLMTDLSIANSSKSSNSSRPQEQSDSPEKSKKTTQSKFIRLIRRRNSSTRHSTRGKLLERKDKSAARNARIPVGETNGGLSNDCGTPSSRSYPMDQQVNESHTVQMKVIGENLGRRATICESLLGVAISTFPDKLNLMITDIVPNTEAAKQHDIRIGDWLYSINGHRVSVNNVEDVMLRTIVPPTQVTLVLHRLQSSDTTVDSVQTQAAYQSDLVRSFLSSNDTVKSSEINQLSLFSIMYITHDGINASEEETSSDQGVSYCYPSSPDLNALHKIKGAFITLHLLMKDLTGSQQISSQPKSTTVSFNGELVHVVYICEEEELFLLSVPNNKCTLPDAMNLTADIVRCLKFKFQSLSRCFKSKEHYPMLEQFFNMTLSQLYCINTISDCVATRFDQLFGMAHWIPLPRDAQMQIDDALSEFEANDFGSYVNDNRGCQRLYSVIGTCLYHKGYLLSSHLPTQDLVDVNSWCRQRGLLNLIRMEFLSCLVIWHEVFPESCDRGLNSNFGVSFTVNNSPCPPDARWFLLIVGQGNTLLCVLLESGGCTTTIATSGAVGPDIYYVQQAQATLSHIHKIGVPLVADKWLCHSVRPQVVSPGCNKTSSKRSVIDSNSNVLQQSKERETSKSCENLQPSKLNLSHTAVSNSSSKLTSVSSAPSIVRQRNSPDSSVSLIASSSSSPHQQPSLHRTTCPDEISEDSTRSSIISDEVISAPILGRRAERERERERAAGASDTNSHSRFSDSDFSDDSDWEPKRALYGSRSLDVLLDSNKPFSADSVSVIPSSLLAGKQNALFHYVQLVKSEGIMISPPVYNGSSQLLQQILEKFQSTAQSIHLLLQNTVDFKKLNVQEVHESRINKSLVAIKECGALFEAELEQSKKSNASTLNFWVVGRLFFLPHAKEIYVCYEESAPQNMVEIAFRLALSASG